MHWAAEVWHNGERVGYVEYNTVVDLVGNPAIRKTHEEFLKNCRTGNDRDRKCVCGKRPACVTLRVCYEIDDDDEWPGFACLDCGVLLASNAPGMEGLGVWGEPEEGWAEHLWNRAIDKYGPWVCERGLRKIEGEEDKGEA